MSSDRLAGAFSRGQSASLTTADRPHAATVTFDPTDFASPAIPAGMTHSGLHSPDVTTSGR